MTTTSCCFVPVTSRFRLSSRSRSRHSRDGRMMTMTSSHFWVSNLEDSGTMGVPMPTTTPILMPTDASMTSMQFDPIYPSPTTLVGMLVILVLCVASAVVWNTQVVPVSRTKLAISKARGPVQQYLQELSLAGTTTAATTTTFTKDDHDDNVVPKNNQESGTKDLLFTKAEDMPLSTTTTTVAPPPPTITPRTDNSRALERWLFADWLNTYQNKKTKKEPAIPVLKSAKWNSGDNPVLVTAAMMIVGIVIASCTEREWHI